MLGWKIWATCLWSLVLETQSLQAAPFKAEGPCLQGLCPCTGCGLNHQPRVIGQSAKSPGFEAELGEPFFLAVEGG